MYIQDTCNHSQSQSESDSLFFHASLAAYAAASLQYDHSHATGTAKCAHFRRHPSPKVFLLSPLVPPQKRMTGDLSYERAELPPRG